MLMEMVQKDLIQEKLQEGNLSMEPLRKDYNIQMEVNMRTIYKRVQRW